MTWTLSSTAVPDSERSSKHNEVCTPVVIGSDYRLPHKHTFAGADVCAIRQKHPYLACICAGLSHDRGPSPPPRRCHASTQSSVGATTVSSLQLTHCAPEWSDLHRTDLDSPLYHDLDEALICNGVGVEDVQTVITSHLHFHHYGQNYRFGHSHIFVIIPAISLILGVLVRHEYVHSLSIVGGVIALSVPHYLAAHHLYQLSTIRPSD